MLQREGAEPAVFAKFYSAVIQAVLLFGAYTWVFFAPMAKRLYEVRMGFLRQVTKLKAKKLKDGSWLKLTADRVLQRLVTQPLQTYLDRRQATVLEWVALQPIFEVCTRETGYEGEGNLGDIW